MIDTCLFPAAGFGTRFLPITKTIPKEMLPIGTKPLIEYAVLEAMSAGIAHMGIITNKHKKAIEDYFDYNNEVYNQVQGTDKEALLNDIFHIIQNAQFSYTRQTEIKGLGHAILTGKNLTSNQATAVILADDLCINERGDSVLQQMVELYKKHQCCIVAVEEIDIQHSNKYGIIKGNEIENNVYQISNMIEKPTPSEAPSNLAIIGRYILTPEIFIHIENTQPGKGGEIQITDALLSLAKEQKVLAYKFQGQRFDCGSIEGFLKAANYFAEKQLIKT
jgi:UTP--glucose-1-phosphate uridylyltransferase